MFGRPRGLAIPLAAFGGVPYDAFLAELSRRREVRTYLEIGVHAGHTLSLVACDTAVGVDPALALTCNVAAGKRRTLLFGQTSDRFFAETDLPQLLGAPVDLAFLDGLHLFEVLLRDFIHAEAASGPDSLIALHDCLPLTAEMTDRASDAPREDPEPYCRMWTGDVWKIVPILETFRPDLRLVAVDCPPTGLVCVTGLDPASRVLGERYLDIVAAYRDLPSDDDALKTFHASLAVASSRAVLQDQGLWFRT